MHKIIYLDSAASMQKPGPVIDAQMNFMMHEYANSGRGICARAAAVDDMVATTRGAVARFIGAKNPAGVIFTSGATDGLNRVVNIIRAARANIGTVAVSVLDHHSARLPWMMTDAKITEIPLTADMDIDVDNVPSADVMVISAMSNVLGRPQDVKSIIAAARRKNPAVIAIVDAAQFVVHEKIDVADWDCDFMCWSGHKIGADTGIGIMYIKIPDAWNPDRFGGGMVARIDGNVPAFNAPPDCFEAGTLPLSQISGMRSAIDYITAHRPDMELIKYAYDALSQNARINILTWRDAALLTFVVRDMHVLDFGTIAGARGLCLRVGNMCASWIHRAIGVDGSIRISVGPDNTIDDIRAAVDIINDVAK